MSIPHLMLTIERLIELKDVLKLNTVFSEAGLNANTMRSALHKGRRLRKEEAEAIIRVLAKRGIHLSFQQSLFDEETTGE